VGSLPKNAWGHVYFIFICTPLEGQFKDRRKGPAHNEKMAEVINSRLKVREKRVRRNSAIESAHETFSQLESAF
ncbi:MAG: hypothetical protein ACHQKY_04515, partial [Terriglobia bacterium]